MSALTSCKIINKLDGSENLVCSKWEENIIKFLIFKPGNDPYIGEIKKKNFEIFAKSFKKPLNEYLEEQKKILEGDHEAIDFFIDESVFYWMKNQSPLLQIEIRPTTNIELLTNYMSTLMTELYENKTEKLRLEKNNLELKKENLKLKENLEQTIILKKNLEKKIYPQFIILLNAKKKKIRELKETIEEYQNKNQAKESIFSIETESDEESDKNERVLEEKNEKKIIKKRKISTKDTMEIEFEDDMKDETPEIFNESECEVKLHLDEEKVENILIDSEEIIF